MNDEKFYLHFNHLRLTPRCVPHWLLPEMGLRCPSRSDCNISNCNCLRAHGSQIEYSEITYESSGAKESPAVKNMRAEKQVHLEKDTTVSWHVCIYQSTTFEYAMCKCTNARGWFLPLRRLEPRRRHPETICSQGVQQRTEFENNSWPYYHGSGVEANVTQRDNTWNEQEDMKNWPS